MEVDFCCFLLACLHFFFVCCLSIFFLFSLPVSPECVCVCILSCHAPWVRAHAHAHDESHRDVCWPKKNGPMRCSSKCYRGRWPTLCALLWSLFRIHVPLDALTGSIVMAIKAQLFCKPSPRHASIRIAPAPRTRMITHTHIHTQIHALQRVHERSQPSPSQDQRTPHVDPRHLPQRHVRVFSHLL
jgi:hypothetical protein